MKRAFIIDPNFQILMLEPSFTPSNIIGEKQGDNKNWGYLIK